MLFLFLRFVLFTLTRTLVDDCQQLALFAFQVFLTLGALLVIPQRDVGSFVVRTDDVR